MNIEEITNLIENFAPLEFQEHWDNCGFQIDFGVKDIKKVIVCLSVTENIVNQAIEKECDLILAHHPLFFIPFSFNKGVPIYSAHTNLDVTKGGTTDKLIEVLGLNQFQKPENSKHSDFPRLVDLNEKILLDDFVKLVKDKLSLKWIRVVNNKNITSIKKIAVCAGSGASFINVAKSLGADAYVTGDVKYHDALDSDVIILDVGHFEGERPVLKTIKNILEPLNLEVIIADEKSPFINY